MEVLAVVFGQLFMVVTIEFTIVDAALLFLCWRLQLLCCYYFLAHIRTRILISRCCVAVLVLVVTTAMLLLLCLNSNTRILNSRRCCVICCYYFLTQIRTRSSSRSRSGRSTAKTTQHVLVFFASLLRTMTDHKQPQGCVGCQNPCACGI